MHLWSLLDSIGKIPIFPWRNSARRESSRRRRRGNNDAMRSPYTALGQALLPRHTFIYGQPFTYWQNNIQLWLPRARPSKRASEYQLPTSQALTSSVSHPPKEFKVRDCCPPVAVADTYDCHKLHLHFLITLTGGVPITNAWNFLQFLCKARVHQIYSVRKLGISFEAAKRATFYDVWGVWLISA